MNVVHITSKLVSRLGVIRSRGLCFVACQPTSAGAPFTRHLLHMASRRSTRSAVALQQQPVARSYSNSGGDDGGGGGGGAGGGAGAAASKSSRTAATTAAHEFASQTVQTFQLALEAARCPTNAAAMAKYMRSKFSFYGVKAPALKALLKEVQMRTPQAITSTQLKACLHTVRPCPPTDRKCESLEPAASNRTSSCSVQ